MSKINSKENCETGKRFSNMKLKFKNPLGFLSHKNCKFLMFKNVKFIFVISILLLIPLILAYNYQINVDSNYEEFNTDVYKCTNSGCSNITFHQSSTNGQYSLIDSGDNYYAEYDYLHDSLLCFKPHIYRIHAWGDLSETKNYNITFNKKENCQGDINSGELSEHNISLGESVIITANVHSGFEYPVGIPETTAIPDNIKDEYSTNTKLSIYANDIKIAEAEAEILLASDKDFSFDWTPNSTGTYEITAKSEITDCACSSQETQEFLIGILIVNEPSECCADSDCTADYYSDNYCSNNNVYKDYHDFFCLIGECKENITKELVEECAYDCVNNTCIHPVCGNNIIEQGEECDDGNLFNEDGCDEFCKLEICEHDVGIRYSYENSFGTGIAIKLNGTNDWLQDPVELTQNQNYIIKYIIDNKIQNTTNNIHVVVTINSGSIIDYKVVSGEGRGRGGGRGGSAPLDIPIYGNTTILADYNTSIHIQHTSDEIYLNTTGLTGTYNISVYVEKINETDCDLSDNYAEREITLKAECYDNSDCGGEVCYEADNYCSGGNVYNNYTRLVCNNAGTPYSYCSQESFSEIIAYCVYACNEVEARCVSL